MAVSISVSSVILIIVIILIHQRWRRRRRKTENGQNHLANEVYEPSRAVNETHEPEAIHELSGHHEYELPANPNTLRHELPPGEKVSLSDVFLMEHRALRRRE